MKSLDYAGNRRLIDEMSGTFATVCRNCTPYLLSEELVYFSLHIEDEYRCCRSDEATTFVDLARCDYLTIYRLCLPSFANRISSLRGEAMQPREIMAEMRVHAPSLDNAACYGVGLFDEKVTIHAQQVRARNLAWALRESGTVAPGTRVAVIGGGAAGLTMTAALYGARCPVALFELGRTWMRLQARNDTRHIHPDIYDWPEGGGLSNDTEDLGDFNWTPGKARSVAGKIKNAFANYDHFDPRLSCEITKVAGKGSTAVVHFVDNGIAGQEDFEVVIFCVGFGLERGEDGFDLYSYWENDDFDNAIHLQDKPDIVVGCGDGGLTDAIRLSVDEFAHVELERLARGAGLIRLGERLRAAEAGLSPAEHHALFASADCDPATLAELRRRFPMRGRPVEISDRSGLLYKANASRLNKLLVRHFVEIGAISWRDFAEISVAAGATRALDAAIRKRYHRVVLRIGPQGAIRNIVPDVIGHPPRAVGLRMGNERCQPTNALEKPKARPAPTVLALAAGAEQAGDSVGGGSALELARGKGVP